MKNSTKHIPGGQEKQIFTIEVIFERYRREQNRKKRNILEQNFVRRVGNGI